MGSLQNKGFGKLKYLDSFYYCSNSPKGLLERLRIMRFIKPIPLTFFL